VHWKEEKAPLVLQKEIKAQLVREVKKNEKKSRRNFWRREKPSWFLSEIQPARGKRTRKVA